MTNKVLILVGTKKGAFVLESDAARQVMGASRPLLRDMADEPRHRRSCHGHDLAGGGSEWFGPAVWKSSDLGATWTHSSAGLAYPEGETPIKAVWSLAKSGASLYAGVDPAGLFRSDDGGETWSHVGGLRNHPSRAHWNPGGAGLILHSLLPHPDDDKRIYGSGSPPPACSTRLTAARPGNRATGGPGPTSCRRTRNTPSSASAFIASSWLPACRTGCISRTTAACTAATTAAGSGKHRGGLAIELRLSGGGPSARPSTLYLLPLNGDSAGRYVPDGKAAVWRTRDGGETWEDLRAGLPQGNTYFGVLRQAMATDRLEPAGVYFGTSTGSLYASADEGDSWTCVAQHLPTMLSVETMVVEA